MIQQITILLSITTLVMSITVKNITTCSTNIKEVRIASCTAEPCEFHRNTSPTIAVDFVAVNDSNNLKAVQTAVIAGLEIAVPGFDSDVCNDYGIVCPIQKGKLYTYSYEQSVLQEYPKIKATFKLVIKDDNRNNEVCVSMPVTVVD